MGALSNSGKEGALRARYVEQLEASENQIKSLATNEVEGRREIERLEEQIGAWLKTLK